MEEKTKIIPSEKKYNETGFPSGKDYLSALLELTSLRIQRKRNSSVSGNQTTISNSQLNQRELEIGLILQKSPDREHFPVSRLKKNFSLTAFQLHCIFIALLWEIREDRCSLFPEEALSAGVPGAGFAASVFSEEISLPRLEKEFHYEFRQLFFPSFERERQLSFQIPLKLSKDIRNFLTENGEWELSFARILTSISKDVERDTTTNTPPFLSETHSIITKICQNAPERTLINVCGAMDSGKLYQIRKGISDIKSRVLVVALSHFASREGWLWENQLYDIYRKATLENCAVCFIAEDSFLQGDSYQNTACLKMVLRFAAAHFPFFFLVTEKPYHLSAGLRSEITLIRVEISLPDESEQLKLWDTFFAEKLPLTMQKTDNEAQRDALEMEIQARHALFQSLVNKYQFYPGQIKKAVEKAAILMMQTGQGLSEPLLNTACHASCEKLRELGTHGISSNFDWDDLILSKDQKDILRHACNHVHFSHIVYRDWNYQRLLPYGRNMILLFEGPPGTGKTMAAQIIAKDLGLMLYKVDISKTVSKYIGETEEHLNQIFDEAERSNVVLFIDEMDALFGKRTEIKDSHDKYANTETSFLLQKMESFRGILLLATNHLEDIDEAFIRRINFIIHFSLPDAENRKKLWISMFPEEAPQSRDIDFDFLAENFTLSGGAIKNIVLKSAYLAAAERKEISMRHLLLSLQDEVTKQGKVLLDADFGKYRYLLYS